MQRLFGTVTCRTLQRSASSYAASYKAASSFCTVASNFHRAHLTTPAQAQPSRKHTFNMSTAIVLPPLTTWAQLHLTELFQATDQPTFNETFNGFIAANPESIVVNGKKLSKDEYKQQLWNDKFLEAGAQVQYLGAVSVSSDPDQPVKVCIVASLWLPFTYFFTGQAGEVGVFLQATIDEKLLILGAPETRKVTLSLNLV